MDDNYNMQGLDNIKPKITVILLNYQRPQNIPIILDSISKQTIKPHVFLWNNGDVDVNSSLIDRYEASNTNKGCMVRWELAKKASTPFVMSMDDDICFNRKNALADVIKTLEQQDDPNRIIGLSGSCFGSIPVYDLRKEFMCQCVSYDGNISTGCIEKDAEVDIVKGRVMAFRRNLLDNMVLPDEREDDIYLSAVFSNRKRKFHRIPAILNNAFCELPEHGVGSYYNPRHYMSRDRALRDYFSGNFIARSRLIRFIYTVIIRIMRKLKRFFIPKNGIL